MAPSKIKMTQELEKKQEGSEVYEAQAKGRNSGWRPGNDGLREVPSAEGDTTHLNFFYFRAFKRLCVC